MRLVVTTLPDGHTGAQKMVENTVLDEIRDANLSYLLLAQRLIQEDKPQALYRLGLTEELAYTILSFSTAQLLKIAATNVLICRFRFEDDMVWNLLTSYSKDKEVSGIHAAILMAGQMAEVA
jgi:flagellar transcriptional activator FlhD